MTGDDDVRSALRDLLPGYQGPADPYLRVTAALRRRRRAVRTRLAVAGTAAAAAAAAVVVPMVLVGPGQGGLSPAAPRPSGPPRTIEGFQPVADGTVGGLSWSIGSTSVTRTASRCLYGDGGPFSSTLVCFPRWAPADGASWQALAVPGGDAGTATAVFGVVPAGVRRAAVVFRDGGTTRVDPTRTSTDPAVGFFAVVVEGDRQVAGVTLLDGAGRPVAATDTDPDEQACPTGRDVACGTPVR